MAQSEADIVGEQRGLQPSDATATGVPPLIVTKIRVPRRRPDLLPRQRLVNFIHDHVDGKLILISAPAGYGKTSLLTDFARDTDLPVCWYTLDSFDRDLRAFLEHLVAAIALRFPAFGRRSRAYLRETTDPGANLYPLVATLVQEIYDTIPEYFCLVLDDHHTVEDQEQINEFLDLFLTHVDENCHLIIVSRALPALPNLSLWLARRQATGLSVDELRFTPQEIQALAKQNYKLDLSPEQAAELAERTGGWITGLLLTAAQRWELSVPGEAEAGTGMAVRGRINVDVYDYLSRQVLSRQPAPLRDFLLASSVLDELSPELCATVLGIEQPARTDDVRALMDQVRIRNLFIIEFEGEQNRLRYQDLFREFLQDTLRRQDEARFCELTLRAAGAYAERGDWERAVSRYLLLNEYEQAARLICRIATPMHEAGRWNTLAGWIDALPETIVMAYPWLLVNRGKIHIERSEHAQALSALDRAERQFSDLGHRAASAHALALKGYVLRFQGHYAAAIALSQKALALVGDTTPVERFTMAVAHKNVGVCYFRLGQLAEGGCALHQALDLYQALGDSFDIASVHHDLGLGSELAGDLEGAVEHYRAALQSWEQLGHPAAWANTLNGLGVVYQLQGRYEEASQALDEALAKARQAGDLRVEAFVWASLGDLHRDLGAYERARQAYLEAAEVANRGQVGFIPTYARNGLGNLLRLQGERAQAGAQLQKALELAKAHGAEYEAALCHTSLGVLAGETKDLAAARDHLDYAVQRFEAGGFRRDLAVAWLHQAHIAFLAGDGPAALAGLQRVLDLAGQLGFDQFLVVEGQRLSALLRYARAQGVGEQALPRLLERIEIHQAQVAAHPEPAVELKPRQALRIYALGPPRVEQHRAGASSGLVQWTTAKSRDLFFCLVQHSQGLSKEEIGVLFWPDHPPHKLDGIFRSSLYRLRRSMFRECVVFDEGRYRFNWDSEYWFDVEVFEQGLAEAESVTTLQEKCELLEEGLHLYRGDYLQGIYAEWCLLERERLRTRHLAALELLARAHAEQGNLQQAVEKFQHLVALDPYREPAYRELMRCHYRLGDRVAAVRQYHACVQILRQDLGLSPAPETEELYREIVG